MRAGAVLADAEPLAARAAAAAATVTVAAVRSREFSFGRAWFGMATCLA